MSSQRDSDQNVFVDRRTESDVRDPPRGLRSTLAHIGPGLIIAANIVGSGELIMTTKTGAAAGIALLWLIIFGCVVKVFVQLELGRFTISEGQTTLAAFNRAPGPRLFGVNWVVLAWGFMMLTTVAQLGGIVGGVGQALALTVPITGDYQELVAAPSEADIREYALWEQKTEAEHEATDERSRRRMGWVRSDLERMGAAGEHLLQQARENATELTDLNGTALQDRTTNDDRIWVVLVGIATTFLLTSGRYSLIEKVSVVLVVSFTFITLGNVLSLQFTPYRIEASDVLHGLSFRLPQQDGAMLIALATFGIIGVGATELISYPYWCLEKGYARFAGPRTSDESWLLRARGWFRVMKADAFSSMVIYTLSTMAFFIMGVAVLHRDGRDPENSRLVITLAQSYVPIFGAYAKWLFLSGAVAVLYSTYLVANAGNARMVADFFGVIRVADADPDSASRQKLVRVLSGALPLACVAAYLLKSDPLLLVAIAGLTQTLMLPVIGFCAVWFRHRITDARLRPGKLWDVLLIASCVALFTCACVGAGKFLTQMGLW